MVSIQSKMHPTVGTPAKGENWQWFPVKGVKHSKIPSQHMDLKTTATGDDSIQECPQLGWEVGRWIIADKLDATINIPADDENGLPGTLDGSSKGRKIGRAINQEGRPLSADHPPTVLPLDADTALFHDASFYQKRLS